MPNPFDRHTLLSCLAALAALTGCLDAPDEPDLASDDQSIFAQVVGAHQTGKTVTWDVVGNNLDETVALTSATASNGFWLSNVNHAVYRDTTGCLRHESMNDTDGIWHRDTALTSCDPGFGGAPGAASWAVGRLDVFWFSYFIIGPTRLSHAFYDGTWHYEDLGATATAPIGAPAVGSWGVGHLDVMWRDSVGDLRWRSFDRGKRGAAGYTGAGWTIAETKLTSYLAGSISITEPAVNEIHVAYRTSLGKLAHFYKTPTTAWTFENTAVAIDTAPSLTSWGPGHVVAYASRGGTLRQITSTPSGWVDQGWTSNPVITGPVVAAAALGRANRVDVLTSFGDGIISHTLYQESLPGFTELFNPQTKYWCWANAPGVILNYLYGDLDLSTCGFVSAELGVNCCTSSPPNACLTTGDPEDVMDTWGLIAENDSSVLSATQLRLELYNRHTPVLSHHSSNISSTNHIVVLRDIYAVDGVDYVVIADPGDNGRSWVWPYATYLAYDTNWSVDYMFSGLHL